MTKEEAYDYLMKISWDMGLISIENYTTNDADKMREAIRVLYLGDNDEIVSK